MYINSKISDLVAEHLKSLLDRSEAEAAYLCDKGGNIIVSQVASHYGNEDNIAALAAGSFSATNALAGLIGEEGFNCIFHQSDNMSMFMQSQTAEMLLLVLFGARSNPGLVKLHANEFTHTVTPMIRAMHDSEGEDELMKNLRVEIDTTQAPFKLADSQ